MIASEPTNSNTKVSVRRYLEKQIADQGKRFAGWIEERDHRYEDRFISAKILVDNAFVASEKAVQAALVASEKAVAAAFVAADKAVNAALVSQEKATSAAFQASEKAITKAEEAQKEYNARSNEFRAALDDQAQGLMPRFEAMGLNKAADEKLTLSILNFDSKLGASSINFDQKLDARTRAVDSALDQIRKDIGGLRESRSALEGSHQTQALTQHRSEWSTGLLIAVTGGVISSIISIIGMIAMWYRVH
jgi:hypothetical protein